MLCAIYKSVKREGAYLYLPGRDRFESVPAELKTLLGSLSLVLLVDLTKKQQLMNADINKVKKALIAPGYYFQMPPLPEDNLALNRSLLEKIATQTTDIS